MVIQKLKLASSARFNIAASFDWGGARG